jgi:putative acetyltransferase
MRGVPIRMEQEDDRSAVRSLHLAAFGDHGPVVADLVDALRDEITTEDGLSLVAVDRAGTICGHVMFTRGWLDAPRRLVDVHVLSPLAVLPDRQGQGIGSALISAGLEVMIERAVPVVFLEGDPAFYARLGFAAGGGLGFRKPSLRIPDLAFQAIRLPGHQPWMTGTLVYADTFWRHDAVGLRDPSA